MTKIEKLKELNVQLSTIVKELEMRIFIENVDDVRDRKKFEESPRVHAELNQQL
jgi:hypothetical protein